MVVWVITLIKDRTMIIDITYTEAEHVARLLETYLLSLTAVSDLKSWEYCELDDQEKEYCVFVTSVLSRIEESEDTVDLAVCDVDLIYNAYLDCGYEDHYVSGFIDRALEEGS